MDKQVIIQVSPDGEVKIDAVGFKGNACTKATAALIKAMGQVTSNTPKPEMYQQQTQEQKAGL